MNESLAGQVVALIGTGSPLDRALAMACAEAGADLALATTTKGAVEEFAMNSIANEAWAVGREQFVAVLDALDDAAVIAFAEQTWDRYGRCDALICAHNSPSSVPLDELSPAEFETTLRANLVAPFLAAQAFGRLMERAGRGKIVFLAQDVTGVDASAAAAASGLDGLARAVGEAWADAGVTAVFVRTTDGAAVAEVATQVLVAVAGIG